MVALKKLPILNEDFFNRQQGVKQKKNFCHIARNKQMGVENYNKN